MIPTLKRPFNLKEEKNVYIIDYDEIYETVKC
jgi:hypothetical protein